MKICNLLALDDFGGLQTLYVSLATHLSVTGSKVTTVNRAVKAPIAQIERALTSHGNEIFSPKNSRRYRFYGNFSSFPSFKEKQEQAYLKAKLASFFADAAISRVIGWNALPVEAYLPRDGDFVLYDHGLSSIQRPHSLNRKRLNHVHSVISISKSNRRMLEERWGWSGPTTILQNPLRHEIAIAPIQEKSWYEGRALIVGVACRLVSFKGVASVLHAASILRSQGVNLELRIAGDGPEQARLTKQAQKLGIADAVYFEGVVQDMARFFSSIDILVAPSLREPFGLTPLEAIACGVPTLLSEVDGHPEVLPFPAAAKLIKPDLALRDYKDLGASLSKMPEFVYDPALDTIVKPRALDPSKLAGALREVAENYSEVAIRTREAANVVRRRNDLANYATSFLALTATN